MARIIFLLLATLYVCRALILHASRDESAAQLASWSQHQKAARSSHLNKLMLNRNMGHGRGSGVNKRSFHGADRMAGSQIISDCMTVSHSEDGLFTFVSQGETEVCGLYLVGRPDQRVELTVVDSQLQNDCSQEIFVIVDGWELNGNVVPSEDDHPLPLSKRFTEICDKTGNSAKLTSHQNAAMVQYKIPTPGHGFTVSVKYIDNPDPCNVLMSDVTGVFKISNNGEERNCSVTTLLFPAKISLLEVDVGAKVNKRGQLTRFRRQFTGIIPQCEGFGERDFLELGGAGDLTSRNLDTKSTICGYQPKPAEKGLTILCGSSTIRLVSSGEYSNSVTVMVRAATTEDLDTDANIVMACPDFDI